MSHENIFWSIPPHKRSRRVEVFPKKTSLGFFVVAFLLLFFTSASNTFAITIKEVDASSLINAFQSYTSPKAQTANVSEAEILNAYRNYIAPARTIVQSDAPSVVTETTSLVIQPVTPVTTSVTKISTPNLITRASNYVLNFYYNNIISPLGEMLSGIWNVSDDNIVEKTPTSTFPTSVSIETPITQGTEKVAQLDSPVTYVYNTYPNAIRGPQGPQGPQGPAGPAGSSSNLDLSQFVSRTFFDRQLDATLRSIENNSSSGGGTWGSITGTLSAQTDLQTVLNTKITNPMTTGGDLIYGGASGAPTRLGNGTAGQVLQSNGTTLAPTWETLATGGDAETANPLSQFAATTSLELLGVISDETGSGSLVFANSPTLVTPNLGTPSALVLTNATGLPAASVLAGTFGTGAYVMDTSLSVPSIITASGALGITPATGSNLNINLSTTGDLAINTDDLYVDTSTGRVGIGITAPLLVLDVAGSGRFTGTATSVLTGSINPTASASVVGVGTAFTTELVVGDRITVSGETRTVTAITDNTNLTVNTPFTDTADDASPDKLPATFIARNSSNVVKMVLNDLELNVGSGGLTHDFDTGITAISTLEAGPLNFDTDAGVVSWVDMEVSADPADNTIQSYSAQLDGNPILTIYGLADSIGGVDTMGVGIGDITPEYRLDVETDIASSYVANFFNDGNDANRGGIVVSAGLDDHTAVGPSTLVLFQDGDQGTVGSITFASSATAYNTSSDLRLKENIVDTSLSLDLLNQVKVRDFNFISDKDRKLSHGFIAQELYQIYPLAVTVPINPEDNWMVDYSKLTPLVVKSIQELDLKIEGLDERISALEALGQSPTGDANTGGIGLLGQYAVDFFNSVIQNVVDGVIYMKGIVTETLKVGSPEKRTGITLYDEITGEPYCLSIANGIQKTTTGECVIIENSSEDSSDDNEESSAEENEVDDTTNEEEGVENGTEEEQSGEDVTEKTTAEEQSDESVTEEESNAEENEVVEENQSDEDITEEEQSGEESSDEENEVVEENQSDEDVTEETAGEELTP